MAKQMILANSGMDIKTEKKKSWYVKNGQIIGQHSKLSLNGADIIISHIFFVDLAVTFTRQCKAYSYQPQV